MKKLLLFVTIMLASMGSKAQTVEPDSEGMTLSAQEWTRDVVMGWNLGNSLECPNTETEWGNPKTTKAMIHAVREAGFNAIRIPIRWINHVTDPSTMTINSTWLARVKEVVDWALEEDMYVIINSHHEDWYDRNPYYNKQEENNAKLSAMWKNIATFFRDYGEKLIFAGTNGAHPPQNSRRCRTATTKLSSMPYAPQVVRTTTATSSCRRSPVIPITD